MNFLEEITKAAAETRAVTAQAATDATARRRQLVETQQAGLLRWNREIEPAIWQAVQRINEALGGRGIGNFLDEHSLQHSEVRRFEPETGEAMSITLRLIRGGRYANLIKLALETTLGTDPVIFTVSREGRSVVRLVVDAEFKREMPGYWLERTVRDCMVQP